MKLAYPRNLRAFLASKRRGWARRRGTDLILLIEHSTARNEQSWERIRASKMWLRIVEGVKVIHMSLAEQLGRLGRISIAQDARSHGSMSEAGD